MTAAPIPEDPAASLPRAGRAARASVPGGPATPSAPGVAGGKMSRQAVFPDSLPDGTPGPETRRPGRASVRAGDQAPAGRASDLTGGKERVPAGSTGALFVDVQDTERATLERARRADSKAFLDAYLAGKMTEAELEEQIRDACKKLGIIRFHVRFSVGTTPGLPDDILIGPRGILWRECKTRKGKLTEAQVSAGEALRAAGQDWDVWRPEDWFSGRIAQELAALAKPGAP